MDIPYRTQGAILDTEDGVLSVGWLIWHFSQNFPAFKNLPKQISEP